MVSGHNLLKKSIEQFLDHANVHRSIHWKHCEGAGSFIVHKLTQHEHQRYWNGTSLAPLSLDFVPDM